MSLTFYGGDPLDLDLSAILGENYGKVKTSEIYDGVSTIYPMILIRRENETKIGQIWLPDDKLHDSKFARVVAIHRGLKQPDGTHTHLPGVEVGQKVLVLNLDEDNLKDPDDPYLGSCREVQIMAVINEDI